VNVQDTALHRAAALYYGSRASHAGKIDWHSEERALRAGDAINGRNIANDDPRRVEAYPCVYCAGWHVGRVLSPAEREWFTPRTTRLFYAVVYRGSGQIGVSHRISAEDALRGHAELLELHADAGATDVIAAYRDVTYHALARVPQEGSDA